MILASETFSELVHNLPHWEFEAFSGGVMWAVSWYPRKLLRDARQRHHDREVHHHD